MSKRKEESKLRNWILSKASGPSLGVCDSTMVACGSWQTGPLMLCWLVGHNWNYVLGLLESITPRVTVTADESSFSLALAL